MYRLPSLLLGTLLASSITVPAQSTGSAVLTFDVAYDDLNLPLDNFACSGSLETKGYSTIGSLPTTGSMCPGAAFLVKGWGSTKCGSCFEVTYNNNTINILAVDKVDSGFTVSLEAMIGPTGDPYQSFVTVNYTQFSCDLI